MSVLILPVCPTSCSASLVPVEFDECAPVLHYGEVSKIYIGEANSSIFSNVEDFAEWTARLDDTGIVANAILTLITMGEVTAPDRTETPLSGGRTIYSPGTYTLNFEVDETNDINYNFMLNSQCNLKYKFWYETSDGMLYGGNEGLEGVIKLNQPVPKSREEIIKLTGEIKWKSATDPLRCVMPIA
jgi:hypothetical protein